MAELNEKQIIDYFHRSFTAVDGLWFLKFEEKYGFVKALEIDSEVWKVMPKIQARTIKSMLGEKEGTDALLKCLNAKFTIEGFKFTTEKTRNGFTVSTRQCPWNDQMTKHGRTELSGTVGTKICGAEYAIWASEFDKDIHFTLEFQKCKGSEYCTLVFET
jgi:hypothetical protein